MSKFAAEIRDVASYYFEDYVVQEAINRISKYRDLILKYFIQITLSENKQPKLEISCCLQSGVLIDLTYEEHFVSSVMRASMISAIVEEEMADWTKMSLYMGSGFLVRSYVAVTAKNRKSLSDYAEFTQDMIAKG